MSDLSWKNNNSFQIQLSAHPKCPELLAPAGSYETCRAVIHAGADAVYLGGSHFGARAYADNFTKEELLSAIDYAHLYGRKIYLTVNTLFKQREIEQLYDYLLPYYEQGLDAVIVQDFGVMRYIHTCFPKLPIHISTQMSVTDAYGANFLKNFGAVRIVPARELSLEEIRTMKNQAEIELECFVHGALCYCYSGQCLLSSMLGGRSGNRGRCAQPCRLPYTVLDADRHQLSKTECYPLSMKDLCTIDHLLQLIESGIDSFKIEGRMKSAEYAAGVTAIYRKYMDLYQSGRLDSFFIQKRDHQKLLETGSRSGFTDGYYYSHNSPAMISLLRPSHKKTTDAYLQSVHTQYMENAPKIPVNAKADLKIGEPARLSVSCGDTSLTVTYGQIQAAEKQPLDKEMIFTQLSRTGNTPFFMESISIHMDQAVFLPKQALNQLRRKALDGLTKQMLGKYHRSPSHTAPFLKDCKTKTQDLIHPSPYKINFTASVEEETQLYGILDYDFIFRIYLDSSMYAQKHFATQLKEHITRIKAVKKQAYLILPAVFRQKTAQFYQTHWDEILETGIDGFLVKTFDELGFLQEMQLEKDRCVLDHSLYAYSNFTALSYCAAGWNYHTIPLELNKKELLARNNTFDELIIYGYLPLMVSAQCICKTFGRCSKKSKICYLKDRYAKEFPVRNHCSECYNTIYNTQPLSLIQLEPELNQLCAASYRLHFTIESKERVCRILDCCRQSFFDHHVPDLTKIIGAYTNGHYKRGVE